MPPGDDLIRLASQYRAALERQDAAALSRLINAYGGIYRKLEDKIAALALEIVNGEFTRGQVVRLARYRSLLADLAHELQQFQSFTAVELDSAARAAIEMAARDSLNLVRAAAGIELRLGSLPVSAIQQLLGFLQPGSPLYKRLELLAPTTAQLVADTIVASVGLGYNPRKIARLITDSLGQGLTTALRMTRTVQLYAYREASRANYVVNSDVVDGWIWFAKLDDRTCLSCISQHGSLHPLTETLNDHHNGRCAPLPHVIGTPNPVTPAGRDWFGALPVEQQRAIMGPGRYAAYTAGRFQFAALSALRHDDVYGPMRVEAALKALAGGT